MKNKSNRNDTKATTNQHMLYYNNLPTMHSFINQCNKSPLIYVKKMNFIEINCSCKTSPVSVGLNDFLSLIEHNKTLSQQLCVLHQGNKLINYCKTCDENICSACTDKHKNMRHLIFPLLSTPNKSNSSLANQYETSIEQLKNMLKQQQTIKDEIVQALTLKINQLNEAFNAFKQINSQYLRLIEIMFDYHLISPNDPNIQMNLTNLTTPNLNVPYYENTNISFKDIDMFIKYYNNNLIINSDQLDYDNNNNSKSSNTNSIEHFNIINTINAHTKAVKCLSVMNGHRIVTCSNDKTIKVFSFHNNKPNCDIVIEKPHGDKHDIYSLLCLQDGVIVSGGSDGKINIWHIEGNSHSLQFKLSIHTLPVIKIIKLSNNRFASCSADKTIAVLSNADPFEIHAKLKGHFGYVWNILQLKGKEWLLSVSDDLTIRSWNLRSYEQEKALHKIRVTSSPDAMIETLKGFVCIGMHGGVLIIEPYNMDIIKEIKDNKVIGNVFVNCLENMRDVVVCGCTRGKIINVDINNFSVSEHKKRVHETSINCIALFNGLIITASEEGELKIIKM